MFWVMEMVADSVSFLFLYFVLYDFNACTGQ